MNNPILRIAVQKSGRLSEQSLALLKKAGFAFEMSERSLISKCSHFPLEILFLRAEDIPEIVHDGTADLGIAGENTIIEKAFNLKVIEKLGFGKCRLSIAVPENKKENFVLARKKIATSYPRLLKTFLTKEQITAEVVELSGSVEIAPRLGMAEVICDLVSTGSTLKMNGLIEYQRIFNSEAVLVAKDLFAENQKKIFKKFLMRIRSVLCARRNKYVVMNAPKESLETIKQLLPGLKNPTISPLVSDDWVSISTVVEEEVFWETIEKLKKAGATGILVLPIENMIL